MHSHSYLFYRTHRCVSEQILAFWVLAGVYQPATLHFCACDTFQPAILIIILTIFVLTTTLTSHRICSRSHQVAIWKNKRTKTNILDLNVVQAVDVKHFSICYFEMDEFWISLPCQQAYRLCWTTSTTLKWYTSLACSIQMKCATHFLRATQDFREIKPICCGDIFALE